MRDDLNPTSVPEHALAALRRPRSRQTRAATALTPRQRRERIRELVVMLVCTPQIQGIGAPPPEVLEALRLTRAHQRFLLQGMRHSTRRREDRCHPGWR